MIIPTNLVERIEKKTGLEIEEIRDLSPYELKLYFSKRTNRNLTFSSEFPFIGRGNVLRDGLKTSNEINHDIDKILGL